MACKVCDFFEKSKETKEKIEAVNNAILRENNYKDIEALLVGFKNDTRLPIPSAYHIKKHKANCLSGLVPPPLEPKQHIGTSVNLDDKTDIVSEFKYTDVGNMSIKELRKTLKNDWLYCSRQFTDILMYKLQNANPDHLTTCKDIVSALKTMADMHFFDSGKIDYEIDDENKITSVNISILPPANHEELVAKIEGTEND